MTPDDLARVRVRTHRRAFLGVLAGAAAASATGVFSGGMPLFAQDLVYQCPMDPDVRSNVPGVCPRCGMTLRSGIPEPTEFPMDFSFSPKPARVGAKTELAFTIRDPQNDKQVEHFQIVHEKLFHLFVVSSDLNFFVHDHPVFGKDSVFRYQIEFPRAGMYRILGDFFPDGATPQLNAKTIFVPGGSMETPHLTKNYDQKQMSNMGVSITTQPPVPIAGIETRIFIHLTEAEGLEKYIGAWCHMLAASDDVIDLMHSHPFVADGGPEMRFDVYFPRAKGYRVWFQFQKKGVVNTAYFDIPVADIESASGN
jgi:hypothetical protein